MLLSPEAECSQHKPALLPACPGAAAVPVGQPWDGLGCSTSRCTGRYLSPRGWMGWCCHSGLAPCRSLDVVCSATSLGFKVLAVLCGALSVLCRCCSLVRAKPWMRAAWCWQGTPHNVLLDSPSCPAKIPPSGAAFLKTWHVCFTEHQGPFQVVILSSSASLRAFPLTCTLSLEQLFLFLNRNTIDQTNLFVSAHFFSCADSDIRFPLQFISGSCLDSVRCWVLLPSVNRQWLLCPNNLKVSR